MTRRDKQQLPPLGSTSTEASDLILGNVPDLNHDDRQIPSDTRTPDPPTQVHPTPNISASAEVHVQVDASDNLLSAALKELSELRSSILTLTKECENLRRDIPHASQTNRPQVQPNISQKDINISAWISEIRSSRCVSELCNLEFIRTQFTVHEQKLKCLMCHVNDLTTDDGISIPESDEACFIPGKRVQSKAFLNAKQRTIDHLCKSKSHQKSMRELSEEEILEKRLKSKNSIAGLSAGTLIYSMVQQKDSYASYEQRVLMCSLIPGTYMGDVNHSRKFVPQFIRTMHAVLRENFIKYMKEWDIKLGFPLPFSVTADKDSNRHRSRQVRQLKIFPFCCPLYCGNEMLNVHSHLTKDIRFYGELYS